MAEDPQPMTLQQRIAALNAAHIGRLPGDNAPVIRPKPHIPDRRPAITKHHSINIPQEQLNGSVTDTRVGNQPNGPPQLPTRQQPPPLPNRSGPGSAVRSPSVSSTASTATTDTASSRLIATRTNSEENRVKAPAWGTAGFPVVQPQLEAERPQPARAPSYGQNITPEPKTIYSNGRKTLPPPLPGRKSTLDVDAQPSPGAPRKLPPMHSAAAIEQAKRSAFSQGLQLEKPLSSNDAPAKVNGSFRQSIISDMTKIKPPPVPLASRPDLSAIQASKPKFASQPAFVNQQLPQHRPNECMTCRDFSGPDNHAARFPRHQVTSLADLGRQLAAPFSSLTDKARAIFFWLHLNISYDVDAFFNHNVQPSTPKSTLQSGLAVCEGYSALFSNLASHAGLESVAISGDGKGFGHEAWVPGQSIPPFSTNHAWNAVKIDGGEWKLIDSCWGAGHVSGKGLPYTPKFNPSQFTMSNEQFGLKHFPQNKNYFFLPSGHAPPTWEKYFKTNPDRWPYDCEPPTLFSNASEDYAIGKNTLLPRDRKINVRSPGNVRIQFGLFCEHWTLDRHDKGPPPVFILKIYGLDGRKDDFVPLERVRGTNPGGGGDIWYVDIPARELGAPGQTMTIYAIMTFGERKNCRGLLVREFMKGKGKVGMSFNGVAAWDLV